MSQSNVHGLASQWFDEYARLAYWVARRWTKRLLDGKGQRYSVSDIEELSQDAVCRGYDRFAKRCAREVCGQSVRKRWVCQCVMRGARDAVRSKSRFGSISSLTAVRDDAMNRFRRITPSFTHGTDNEQALIEQLDDAPVAHGVQRWELEQFIAQELPSHLQATATYAACGLTQEQSATLQGVTARTVRSRLNETRGILCPEINAYAVICEALLRCLSPAYKASPTSAAIAS